MASCPSLGVGLFARVSFVSRLSRLSFFLSCAGARSPWLAAGVVSAAVQMGKPLSEDREPQIEYIL